MFCQHVFGNISSGFRSISRFFWEFRGISRKYQNFAGPRPREISEALLGGYIKAKGLFFELGLTGCGLGLMIFQKLDESRDSP